MLNDNDSSFALQYVQETLGAWLDESLQRQRPCVLFRPTLTKDGDQWCALYGVNLQDGVAGFGDSPEAAMEAFDRAWSKVGGE